MFSKKSNHTAPLKGKSQKQGLPTIIPSDVHLLGNIASDGLIDIDGKIDGNVKCHHATIRKNGVVKGDVIAEAVQIYGKVYGLVKAHNVQCYKGCRVEGIIEHESLIIEDGAFVDGRFKRVESLSLEESEPFPLTDEKEPFIETGKKQETPEPAATDKTAEQGAAKEKPAKRNKEKSDVRVLENLRLISDSN